MESKTILKVNKTYWNANADKWFGTTAMPEYGVKFITENELHFRKISTYINAMIDAGFIIDGMVEQTDEDTLQMTGEIDDKSRKAQKLPLSFVFKARKA